MAVTLYTTTEQIRAALGVTVKELSDEIMTGLQLDFQLEAELDVLVPTHADIKTAGEAGALGSPERKAWQNLQLLAMYVGAIIFDDNRQMWSVQEISDGDFSQKRFSKDDLETLRSFLIERRNFYAGGLNPDLVQTEPGSFFSIVPPGYDPVTNE
jgi:hypothetical protein